MDVFVNYPYDPGYAQLRAALIFAIMQCGHEPIAPLDDQSSKTPRMEKITAGLRRAPLSVHDLSRMNLRNRRLPRYNMPFELGLALGIAVVESNAPDGELRDFIIFDSKPGRYKEAISDFAGSDIKIHHNKPEQLIWSIVAWLNQRADQAADWRQEMTIAEFNTFWQGLETKVSKFQKAEAGWALEKAAVSKFLKRQASSVTGPAS